MTYLWTFVIGHGPTYGVKVPFLAKDFTITIDGPKKESLKEP